MNQLHTKVVYTQSDKQVCAVLYWEVRDINLIIYWAIFGDYNYNKITLNISTDICSELLSELENLTPPMMLQFMDKISTIEVDSVDTIETYLELLKILWDNDARNIYSFIPYERIEGLQLWFDMLLSEELVKAKNSCLKFDAKEQELTTQEFIIRHITRIRENIDNYNEDKERNNSFSFKPTKHVLHYIDWLKSLNSNYMPNTKEKSQIKKENEIERKIDEIMWDFRTNFYNEREYELFKQIYFRYFQAEEVCAPEEKIKITGKIKTKFGFALGELYRKMKKGKFVYPYLLLAIYTFDIFEDERILTEEDFIESNLYKYFTKKSTKRKINAKYARRYSLKN